jgi:hypothetical protein
VNSDATPFRDDETAAQRLAGFVTAGAEIRPQARRMAVDRDRLK